MTDRELMQMALDALMTCQEDWIFDGEDERPTKTYDEKLVSAAFKALRVRLAQPEQAPTNNGRYLTGYKAQREWQRLTDEEITTIGITHQSLHQVARAIEANLKEKNGF